jgi:hypothetical protein
MKAYGEVDMLIQVFLTAVLVGERLVSGPGRFTPGEICSYALVINYYAMKAYVGVDAYFQVFYTPVLFGVWSASRFGRFTNG